jgi:YD repeat-containing protein
VTRVVSLQGGGNAQKAGVMIRETMTGGSTHAFTTQFTASQIQFLYRATTGGSASSTWVNDSMPYWVKVARNGSSFSGYMSLDGDNWVQVGNTQTITMAQNVYVGLAVVSTNNNALATATFDNVSVRSFGANRGGLWGTVLSAIDGSLIAGAQVKISQWNTTKASMASDVKGRFGVGNLTAGAYDVTVSASGFGSSVTTGVVVLPFADTTLTINLTAPGSISGKVTQSDGITAIPGANMQALIGQSSAGSATTDSQGNFTISNLGTGNYQVQAFATGYVPVLQSVSLSGPNATLNFALESGGGGAVSYMYDALGRLVGVIDPSGNTAAYSYDAVGNLLSISRYSSAQLSIITFTPGIGTVGTAVTIYGTGFSSTAGQNSVQLNGIAATVQSATTTQIVVIVPSGASTGPITVTTPSGTVTSKTSFTVNNQ